jgi:Acyl dehydratase
MRLLNTNNIKVGDKLPELVIGPISRNSLTIYADASGDHNPIHIDEGFARQVGLPDVIAHGMLIMSYLGQVLTTILINLV